MPPLSQKEIEGASKAFDSVVVSKNVEPLQIETLSSEETGLAVIENIGTYEVTRSIFGKEKVRKKK